MTVLGHRLQAVLRVHPGEGRTLALAVAVAFLADAAIMIAQSSIDALFFARYGVENLPKLYLIVGVAMFLTTAGVGALLARVGRERVFVVIPAAISGAALVGRVALEAEATWVYGALWILQSVAEFTCLLAIWGLAGLVSDTRQAKRFFPLIAAGGVVGLVAGGLATGPLAAILGSENLLLVWAALMGAATAVAWRLVSTRPPTAEAPHRRRQPPGLLAAVSDVRTSPLLRWMSAGALLTSLLFSLLYLPFSKAAAERYPDADDLAAFFGVFFALSMGTALVFSLLVTSRLLGRLGVPTVVLVLPVLYLVAFGVLAERRCRQHVGGPCEHHPGPPPGPRPRVSHGRSDTARNHGRRRGRPHRPAIRRTSRALRRGPRRLRTCSRLHLPHPQRLPACPGRGPARRTSDDLRHTGGPANPDRECRRRRARRTPAPPHRPRGHRATVRGERPRRPRPSRSGRGAGFCGRGRRRG